MACPAHERQRSARIAAAMERLTRKLSPNYVAQENGNHCQTREESGCDPGFFEGLPRSETHFWSHTSPMDTVQVMERHPGDDYSSTVRGRGPRSCPFNYPVELICAQRSGRIAAGNAVIMNLPVIVLTLLQIAGMMEAAGLPRAAQQVLTGPGELIGIFGKKVRIFGWSQSTGSTASGDSNFKLAAQHISRRSTWS